MLSATLDARTLKLEDYLDLERVSAPQISPDGRTIIYTRSMVDVTTDSFANELWVMNADGSENRRLMSGGSNVQWSPDGTRIAYIGEAETGNEIFVRWMNAEGSVSQITHQGVSPNKLAWSPDGKSIAFLASVPDKPKWDITMPPAPKGANWTEAPDVVDKLHYRQDGVGHTYGKYKHIFVVPADRGTPKQLTSGEWSVETSLSGMQLGGPLEWTPDGKSILFSANTSLEADTEFSQAALHKVDVADGNLHTITRGGGFWGLTVGVKVSPDGKRIAYAGQEDPTVSNMAPIELRVSNIDGTDIKVLVDDVPGYPHFLSWDKNGKGLYYIVGKEGSSNVHYISLSGKSKDITSGAQGISISSVSNAGVAAGTLTSAYKSADVASFKLKDGSKLRTLTAVNDDVLGDVQLGRVEEIWYDSSDNTHVQGWIVYPPNFDKNRKYPLILDIHGGPEGMYNGNFKFSFQYMASQGYIVLYTNPRGSTGYGNKFTSAIYDNYPGRFDFDDLMAGVDTVIDRGIVNEERLYVEGCSGGGVLTAWTITHTDRFAGAAALCSVVDWIGFSGSGDIPAWIYNRYKKPFWEDPSSWLKSSTMMYIDKAKTPTLVMVGKNDIRTPVPQSEELYTGLKMNGVPTKLILFNKEAHGTSRKPSNMLRTQLYMQKWFGEWKREVRAGEPHWVSIEAGK